MPNITRLHLCLTGSLGIPRRRTVDGALLRHLLSFQSHVAGSFPQKSHLCCHLGTSDRPGFKCHSLQRLSQSATNRAILTHIEIRRLSLSTATEEPGTEAFHLITWNSHSWAIRS